MSSSVGFSPAVESKYSRVYEWNEVSILQSAYPTARIIYYRCRFRSSQGKNKPILYLDPKNFTETVGFVLENDQTHQTLECTSKKGYQLLNRGKLYEKAKTIEEAVVEPTLKQRLRKRRPELREEASSQDKESPKVGRYGDVKVKLEKVDSPPQEQYESPRLIKVESPPQGKLESESPWDICDTLEALIPDLEDLTSL